MRGIERWSGIEGFVVSEGSSTLYESCSDLRRLEYSSHHDECLHCKPKAFIHLIQHVWWSHWRRSWRSEGKYMNLEAG